MRRGPWSAVMLATALVAALANLGSARAGADNSRWGASYFPNVVLTTQGGVEVKFYDDLLKGKIVVIDLIYTTCKGACPLETARMAQVQKLLGDRVGKDIFFYSITIDPEHDTPAVLEEYAEKYHAGPGWLFLTGSAEDIELISRKLGLYRDPNPADRDGHAPSVIIGNETTGQWVRNSATDNPRFLANLIGDWMNSYRTAKSGRTYANARPLVLDRGKYVFSLRCAPCHTIGNGARIGPDLAGVTKTRDRQWLERFITAPQQMLEEGDPATLALFEKYKPLQMPGLSLTRPEVGAIIDFIDGESAALGGRSAPTPPASSPAVVTPRSAVEQGLLDRYLRIQEALSSDTLEGIAASANAIAAAWSTGSNGSVRDAAVRLAEARDLATARTAFATLGNAIMATAKASSGDLGDDVRIAYCPMVRKYWLQKGGPLRNPFYGKSMLDCGRFVDRIPDGLDIVPSAAARERD